MFRRAGCTETCSSSSTEACRSNPDALHALRVIPTFYPIHFEQGRCGHPLADVNARAVMFRSRCKSCPGDSSRSVRLTWLAWGASSLATGGTGHPDRALPANPAGVNSSTMKGPQGLASEFCGRRCQTAKDSHRRVRGRFYVRSPEITINIFGANDAGSEELCIRWRSLRVTPDSDVNRKTKNMANAGSSAAAGLVPGAWRGKPGD